MIWILDHAFESDAPLVGPDIEVARYERAALGDADRLRHFDLGPHPHEHLHDVEGPEQFPHQARGLADAVEQTLRSS